MSLRVPEHDILWEILQIRLVKMRSSQTRVGPESNEQAEPYWRRTQKHGGHGDTQRSHRTEREREVGGWLCAPGTARGMASPAQPRGAGRDGNNFPGAPSGSEALPVPRSGALAPEWWLGAPTSRKGCVNVPCLSSRAHEGPATPASGEMSREPESGNGLQSTGSQGRTELCSHWAGSVWAPLPEQEPSPGPAHGAHRVAPGPLLPGRAVGPPPLPAEPAAQRRPPTRWETLPRGPGGLQLWGHFPPEQGLASLPPCLGSFAKGV